MTNYGIKQTLIRDLSGSTSVGNARHTNITDWGKKESPITRRDRSKRRAMVGNKTKFYRIIKSQDAATSSLFYYSRLCLLLLVITFSTLLTTQERNTLVMLMMMMMIKPHATVVGFIAALLCPNHCLPSPLFYASLLQPTQGKGNQECRRRKSV